MGRRKQIDAVVSPTELSVEFGDRHQLDDGDARFRLLGQFTRGGCPRSLARTRPNVKLVKNLSPVDGHAPPVAIRPGEAPRIDDFGRTVRSLRLEARSGIRK